MTRRSLMIAAAAGSALLLAGAYAFQLAGYPPCKLCYWQRWPHAAAVLLGLIAVLAPVRSVAVLGAVAALTTAGVGIYHAGVELAWWEGPSTCTGAGAGLSGMSGADLLSTELPTNVVLCDEVVWSLAGLSMAGWNALLSLALAGLWLYAATRRDRTRG